MAVLLLGGLVLSSKSKALSMVPDSLRVEKRNNKPYIVHKVEPKETLYSLARKYTLPVSQIVEANPELNNTLLIGQLVFIPVSEAKVVKITPSPKPASAIAPASPPKEVTPAAARTFSVDQEGRKWHTVAPGQTLYSLSRMYEIPVQELQALNKLPDNTVKSGQVLQVGKQTGPVKPDAAHYVPEKDDALEASTKPVIAAKPAELPIVTVAETAKAPEREDAGKIEPDRSKYITHSGLAAVINEQFKSNKLLALHRTAPIGSMLQVRNSMNGKSVYVRVIGQLPDTGENDKIIVKISKKAYQALGAIDARFYAEVSYVQGD